MEYEVVLIEDDALPEGVDWALAREPGAFYAFIKASKVTAALLSEIWTAFMEMTARRPVPLTA